MMIQIVARVRGMAPAMNCGRVAVVFGAISSTFMLKMFYRMGNWGSAGMVGRTMTTYCDERGW